MTNAEVMQAAIKLAAKDGRTWTSLTADERNAYTRKVPNSHVSKCGSFKSVNKARVSKHEIYCRKCALKYAGRTP